MGTLECVWYGAFWSVTRTKVVAVAINKLHNYSHALELKCTRPTKQISYDSLPPNGCAFYEVSTI